MGAFETLMSDVARAINEGDEARRVLVRISDRITAVVSPDVHVEKGVAMLISERKSGELRGLRRALDMARGAKDMSGGYNSAETLQAFHHGMDTVANVIQGAAFADETGVRDFAAATVEHLGRTIDGDVLNRIQTILAGIPNNLGKGDIVEAVQRIATMAASRDDLAQRCTAAETELAAAPSALDAVVVDGLRARVKDMEKAGLGVIGEVAAERRKQIAKGYDADHDDDHGDSALPRAAIMLLEPWMKAEGVAAADENAPSWGRNLLAKHGASRRELLIVALALLVAEVERLDRDEARWGEAGKRQTARKLS